MLPVELHDVAGGIIAAARLHDADEFNVNVLILTGLHGFGEEELGEGLDRQGIIMAAGDVILGVEGLAVQNGPEQHTPVGR